MSPAVREAVENARSCGDTPGKRAWSRETVRAIAYAVADGLPSDMTLGELLDELAIAANQAEEG